MAVIIQILEFVKNFIEIEIGNEQTVSASGSSQVFCRAFHYALSKLTRDDSSLMLSESISRLIIKDIEPVNEDQIKAKFFTGNEYQGHFVENQLHGQGTYTWTDGTHYAGEFKNNKITGHGNYTWSAHFI